MAAAKERTADELQNPELNYFIAFDVDLTETNSKRIEDALNNKRKTFARTVTPITTRLTELKDDIDKTMLLDAALRKNEAEAAKRFNLARAIKMAEDICKSGYIEDIKITELAKRFFVDEKSILSGIEGLLKQGVELKKVAAEKREVAFSNYKKIESYLRTLGKRDLYDFSGLPDSASLAELYAAQERLYSEASKKANDSKGKATMDLSGIGKVVFKSDAARKEYDIYYRTKTKVWDILSNNADAGVKTINDTMFLDLADALCNYAGLTAAQAEKELYAYMQNFRITRESSQKIKIAACPYKDCRKTFVATDTIQSCPHCGKALRIKCWNCGNVDLYVSDTTACKKCGISKKHQALFDDAVQKFDAVLKNPHVTEVMLATATNQLENISPQYDKVPQSLIAKKIEAAKQIKIAVCPYKDCGKSYMFTATSRSCPHCGKSLQSKCWNCGNVDLYVSDTTACKKCGIDPKNQTSFDAAQKHFDALFKNLTVSEMDLTAALNQMENILPQYDKVPDSFVAKTVKAAKERLAQLQKSKTAQRQAAEKHATQLTKLVAERKFLAASSVLNQLKMADPSYDIRATEQKISTALKNAELAMDAANRELKLGNEEAAVNKCGEAIRHCADFTTAVQMIKQHPPKAPVSVTARVMRNKVRLEWQISGDQSTLTYTVIRKVGSAPANNDDGDVVERELSLNLLDDSGLVPATAYYYGVYTSRGGVDSPLTVISAPVAVFPDVTALHQEKVSDVIRATWQVPDNAQSVEVYRKAGPLPPADRSDGERVQTDGKTAFTDAQLSQDKYSYLIVCCYSYMGKSVYSAGMKASYTRLLMPEGVANPQIATNGSAADFTFTCDTPKNGTLKLYTAPRQMQLAFGQVDDAANFPKKCPGLKPLDGSLLAAGKMAFSIPMGSILWVYPVVANAELYTVSEPILVNSVVGLDGINVIEQPGSITVEGTLDPKARSITAVLSTQSYVMQLEDAQDTRICSADSFRNDGGMFISLKPGLYYITLFAEYQEGGRKFYSRAIALPEPIDNREKLAVQYVLDYKITVGTAFKVKAEFKCDSPVELPEIDLVCGFPRPMSKSGGTVIGTLPGGTCKKKLFKDGFHYTIEQKVSGAHSVKDRIVLFFHSDSEKRLALKPVQKL